MDFRDRGFNRRAFVSTGVALGLAAFCTPGAFAEELSKTPPLTEGPFYPDKLPLDKDNDLIIVGNSTTPAVGQITHLTGKVMDVNGSPLKDTTIEIWQCDANGAYLHSQTGNANNRDKNFQGFGTFTTGKDGGYRFRTIKPVPYPGRTPHIHVKVKRSDKEILTTQLFINGHQENATDGILRGIRDPLARELLLVDFKPVPESKINELSAHFVIVVGATPSDSTDRRG